jgi:putative ABC transport system permease protein
MDSLIQDLRYAARTLLRSPGFTLVAVLTLALGIGANTAIFSVVNAVLLRSLPYAEPDRLVVVWESNPGSAAHNVVNPGNFLDWRERARSFGGMGVFTWAGITFAGERLERFQGLAVSTGLFGVLGARPLLGRTFVASDADSGAPRTLVLGHALWLERFGGDSAIVGRSVQVAGGLARVVGVMPADFRPLWNEDYWEAFALTAAMRQRSGRYCVVLARLKTGVSVGQAQAEMTLITRGLEREYPQFDKGWSATVVPITEQVVGAARRPLLVLLGAVGFVLLIACANVGNLLLARAAERWREVAVRTALGASRGRITRAWLVECLLLTVAGAVVGLLLATWGPDLLRHFAKDSVPRLDEVRLDVAVLAFTAGVAVVAGLALGIGTAGIAAGRQPASVLKSEDGRTTGGTGLFAVLALVLVAIGIYGVLAYTVRLRVREIGVRMALGADPGAVVRMIVGSGLGFVLAGVAAGVVGALMVTSVLRSLLFGIGPTDLATFVTVTLLLVGIALLASWLPARRAAKVDPVVALRSE